MLKNARAVLWVTAAVLLTMLLGSRFYGWERAVTVTAVHAECKPIYNSVTASGSVEAARRIAVGCKLGFCDACFTGEYPMEVPSQTVKNMFESEIEL